MYDIELLNKIKDRLVQKQASLAVAESVTAGHLQAAFSAAMDASKFFQGGITTYNLGQKARHLKVDPVECERVSCVSQRIAESMALGVCNLFSSDYGIATTGFASIIEECKDEGLYAFVAFAASNKIVFTEKIKATETDPVEVQMYYANTVIKMLLSFLEGS